MAGGSVAIGSAIVVAAPHETKISHVSDFISHISLSNQVALDFTSLSVCRKALRPAATARRAALRLAECQQIMRRGGGQLVAAGTAAAGRRCYFHRAAVCGRRAPARRVPAGGATARRKEARRDSTPRQRRRPALWTLANRIVGGRLWDLGSDRFPA